MIRKLSSTLLFIISTLSCSFAQDFGGHPPSLDWKHINTDSVQIIFPSGMEQQARRAASMVGYMYRNNKGSIGESGDKVNIVFRNQTTIPNGFVALPLFRSELFTTPPSRVMLSALDWNDALTIHEYRHVLQYQNMKRGWGKFMYFLSGDMGWAGFTGLMIPDWYMEGDAVVTETALTNAGRGRTPHFTLDVRAVLLDDKNYNYMKARNNSYKDMVPNHYQLGYVLSSYIRKHYGNETWKNVLTDVTQMDKWVYPFSRNLQEHTGLTTKELYKKAYEELKAELKAQIDTLEQTPSLTLQEGSEKVFTNYGYPQMTEAGQLLAIKSGYQDISHLVLLENGKEKKLLDLGPSIDPQLTYSNGKAAWTEVTYDPRWYLRDYSVIVRYDLETKKKRYLTSKTKYFSPSFSPDGQRLLVTEMSSQQENRIKIIDAEDGEEMQEIVHPKNLVLRFPRWSKDGQSVFALANDNSRFILYRFSLKDKSWEALTPPTSHVISMPVVGEEHIYFSASFSGIDNIYALNLETKAIHQLTSVPTGAYHPELSADGESLIFRQYDTMGFNIQTMKLENGLWRKVAFAEPEELEIFEEQIARQEGGNILNKFEVKDYEVQNYKGGLGSMKLHSWLPYATPTEAGINLMAENLLHNWQADLGAKYNFNDSVSYYSFDMNYGGFYPVLSAGVEVRPGFTYDNLGEAFGDMEVLTEDKYTLKAGASLPLNLTRGSFNRSINLSGQFRHSWLSYRELPDLNRQISTLRGILLFQNLKRKARQHVKPRFGQQLTVVYDKQLGEANSQWLAQGTFYFPGLMPTHNFYPALAYRWQQDPEANFNFGDMFTYSRGYVNRPDYRDIARASMNYQMPVWHPDLGVWNILYMSRVRTNFFYDFSITNPDKYKARLEAGQVPESEIYRSAGAELFLDLQGFNNRYLQLGIGFRGSYLFDETAAGKNYNFQVIFANILP